MASFLKWLLCLQIILGQVYGTDLGINGHTFPIEEENLLVYLKSKLNLISKDTCDLIQKELSEKYLTKAREPKAIYLPTAKQSRYFLLDPSITVSEDIVDHENNMIITKGTQLNPLKIYALEAPLLFFDGSQDKQIAWAKNENEKSTWILVKGKPLELEQAIKKPIYFDQSGFLATKFGITHIPAKVSQDGLLLKIEEIPIES